MKIKPFEDILNISPMATELKPYLHYQRYIKYLNYNDSPFVVKTRYKDNDLWFNALTGDIIFKEFDEEFDEKYLINNWWKISDKIDPNGLRYYLIDRQVAERIITQHENHFNILPTMKCNARCPYCFEHGVVKEDMSIETAEATAQYIINRYNGVGKVELSWFGGEPTFKSECIDRICEILDENEIPYYSHMTTNGYLLTQIGIEKIKYGWKTRSTQITLDNEGKEYDKVKSYIYKDDPSPFQTVLNGVEMLLKNDISVNIRLNVSLTNTEALKNLIDSLNERFGNYKGFSIYANRLYETSHLKFTDEEEKKLYDNLFEILTKLNKFEERPNEICAATRGTFRTICPDGTILVCEHFDDIEGMLLGNVHDTARNFKTSTIYDWQQGRPETELCTDCWLAPMCSIPQGKCPNVPVCKNENYRNHKKLVIIEFMKQQFDKNRDNIF